MDSNILLLRGRNPDPRSLGLLALAQIICPSGRVLSPPEKKSSARSWYLQGLFHAEEGNDLYSFLILSSMVNMIHNNIRIFLGLILEIDYVSIAGTL